MGVTAMGLVFWPLSFLFWNRPQRLLELALFGGIFSAASVLTLGGMGLQPSAAPSFCFIAYIGLQLLLGARFPMAGRVLHLCLPLLVIGAWTLAGSIILPRVFENQVLVWPQKLDAVGTQMLLAPSRGNYTQDCYVILNLVMFVLTSLFLMRREADLRRLLEIYILGGAVVCLIGAWEAAERLAHVPFPETFLYSNPGWAILNTQMTGPVPRINSTYPEPAACATALTGVLYATVWSVLRGYGGWITRAVVVLSALTLLATTSTTGYVALAAGIVMLFAYAIITHSPRLLRRLALFISVAVLFFGGATATLAVFAPDVIRAAQDVMTDTMDKKNSLSYKERSQKDADAMTAFYQTHGLGTGWGSNRSSSLIPSFLSTIGIVGLVGLLFADWQLLRAAIAALRASGRRQSTEAWVIEATICALLGRIMGNVVSGPSLGTLDLYILVAMLVAATVRLRAAGRQPASVGADG
ncbi:hypothetical protein [Acidomonas methanolica]|uniref:O-antigen polymerase n=1 Tax=Acidomonas methanolica NBRC 104435 TaxID=1231351 RepID=A0A023D9P3_ACIMT|nr:hypothetical protein [Acidomonas methanolica]MBU2655408.1 hypothetical protein [Acidomonas methanolica]TCS23485.1 hypothetical protein EDC31_13015 [Acidomonas methanolica]GAJ30546.1 hypothetical protein Amme_172_015 [Acidomonas methanolica NBRC 104435]GBQ47103.1 hypothetical protein AA0498_0448 [Acidomonas methanolica]GEL00287.1 hypothetical protein AME01nite_27850 [Acidomonas methanolica NBRC 104435]